MGLGGTSGKVDGRYGDHGQLRLPLPHLTPHPIIRPPTVAPSVIVLIDCINDVWCNMHTLVWDCPTSLLLSFIGWHLTPLNLGGSLWCSTSSQPRQKCDYSVLIHDNYVPVLNKFLNISASERAKHTADSRLRGIVQRRKLVDLAKAQAQEVAVLRAEVERLRMKTFPALVQIER